MSKLINNKKDIKPVDENGINHGYWEVYNIEDKMIFKGNFYHGAFDSLCIHYYSFNIIKTYYLR